jgi:hypothetical protein
MPSSRMATISTQPRPDLRPGTGIEYGGKITKDDTGTVHIRMYQLLLTHRANVASSFDKSEKGGKRGKL